MGKKRTREDSGFFSDDSWSFPVLHEDPDYIPVFPAEVTNIFETNDYNHSDSWNLFNEKLSELSDSEMGSGSVADPQPSPQPSKDSGFCPDPPAEGESETSVGEGGDKYSEMDVPSDSWKLSELVDYELVPDRDTVSNSVAGPQPSPQPSNYSGFIPDTPPESEQSESDLNLAGTGCDTGASNHNLVEEVAKSVIGSHVTSLEIWVLEKEWRKLSLAREVTFDPDELVERYKDVKITVNPKASLERRWRARDKKKKRSLAFCGTLECGLAIMEKLWSIRKPTKSQFTTIQRMDRSKTALLENFRKKYDIHVNETEKDLEAKTGVKIVVFNNSGHIKYYSSFSGKKQIIFYFERGQFYIVREFSGFQRIK